MIWAIQSAGKGVEYYYIVGNLCLRYVNRKFLYRCNYLRQLAEWGRQFSYCILFGNVQIGVVVSGSKTYSAGHRRGGGGIV